MFLRLSIALVSAGLLMGQATMERASALYEKTQYKEALGALPSPRAGAAALILEAKIHYQLGDYKNATDVLSAAIKAEPNNAGAWLWLGRAYGRRAETSSFLTAPKYASDCRKAFEKAVELAPRDLEALSDLMEYYMEAPGFLGGGMDKAEGIARRIAEIDPVERHNALARLAEKREDYATAEKELRQAVSLAPRDASRLIDLATFFARRGRVEEAEQAFRQAEELAPNSPRLLFERARFYVEAKRNLAGARELLQRYLSAGLTPDDPSRSEAQQLLKQAGG